MRILIAEDDALLAEGVAQILKAEGHAVDSVTTGERALLATQGEHFDLILLDIGFPESTATKSCDGSALRACAVRCSC